jgi:hypothetical protein
MAITARHVKNKKNQDGVGTGIVRVRSMMFSLNIEQ